MGIYWIVMSVCASLLSSATSRALDIPDSSAIPFQQYSQGEPTNDEQYLMEITNRCRANPLADINRIINSTDKNIQNALDYFDINSADLLTDFAAYTSKPPLAFNANLIAAARNHCQRMADYDYQGHGDYDGGPSTLTERLKAAGYSSFILGGENVYAYAYSAMHAHAAFLVDWGVQDLGHRKLLLELYEDTIFREMGIGIISENDSSTKVGPLLVTEEFGYQNSNVVFITGVVYQDTDRDKFYSPNEGLSDFQIMPDHGQYYAISSASGGYAIPVAKNSGRYFLTATRSDFSAMTASVEVTDKNIKVDFLAESTAEASVSGTVIDAGSNGLPLANVTIFLNPGEYTTTTNSAGLFTITGIQAGTYTLVASMEGYTFEPNTLIITLTSGQTYTTQITAVKDDESIIEEGCFTPGIMLLTLLTLAFGSLTSFCHKK